MDKENNIQYVKIDNNKKSLNKKSENGITRGNKEENSPEE